jgi:DNA-directed RNA polymerase specialized sigma24 family protein
MIVRFAIKDGIVFVFDVIYLAYFAGLNNGEIATELKKSLGAVKTAKSGGHAYLAEILGELFDHMDVG